MSFFNTKELLSELKQIVVSHIRYVESLKNNTTEELQYKKTTVSWSVLECLEHLNLYAEFYNNEIRKRIEKSKYQKSTVFKSGYLGNKFALDMLPKEGMKTMNTFKSKNPIYSKLDKKVVLERFIKLQKELLNLLELANNIDLTKTKTAITLPILKFRLGDTFRFVIYHNQRHIIQAKNIFK
ncbi:DinB family protein [Tenacibaculum finnmarkense]|uniref:DinB family protein n=1 Tax=Tenacibaculum finnmarkense genomovar finnmarkense TaxID=1458503 RepID=A0AAP1WFL7_9FLAO|nr:DinB family protein [Tenacibaculum finnmarkense]MBE7651838.1 DinB family protein [Tenacibaculum finnmarkense genomovar finnmarkense]MBE7694447.1 DinB family protein [Tenacibaculum finnmarkense genomovar finnmarkense]MCD8426053.1 DinB family protein [Tenacibaculum finnmarkense genomovar finnmarkense]MCG8729847.1 DinB family protein [Tenacibaculum finnmarkense]MCG8751866.1 DinB family protein [Tenacibaculum finnmarkense]